MADPNPVTRFFGAALIAVGLLMAVLCGGCGAVFLVMFMVEGLSHPSEMSMATMPLFLGGIPALIGFGLFTWGRSLRRPRPAPWAPTEWPKPPPSGPPPG